jgi:TRAP-type C4-dicarboxylate transport system permease large subunit
MMIGIVTPPMGLALFILVDVSGVSYEKIAKATLPFLIPLIVSLILITFIPSLSLWLPNLVMGKA